MKVKELIEKLQQLPSDMEVFLTQTDDEFTNNMVNTVEVRPIVFVAFIGVCIVVSSIFVLESDLSLSNKLFIYGGVTALVSSLIALGTVLIRIFLTSLNDEY